MMSLCVAFTKHMLQGSVSGHWFLDTFFGICLYIHSTKNYFFVILYILEQVVLSLYCFNHANVQVYFVTVSSKQATTGYHLFYCLITTLI